MLSTFQSGILQFFGSSLWDHERLFSWFVLFDLSVLWNIRNVKKVDGFYLKLHFFTSILSMTDKLRYLPLVSWHIISPEPTRSCSLFTITFPRTWYGWFFNRKTQWYVDLPQLYKAAWLLYLSATSRLESLHNCWMLLRNIPNLTLPSLQEEGKKIIHLCTYLKWSWIILCSF